MAKDYGPGVSITDSGPRAFVRVRGQLYSKRFDRTATKTELQDWRAGKRIDVLRAAKIVADETPAAGTFADDVRTYLNAVTTMPTYATREKDLRAWVTALGPTRTRSSITSAEVRTVLQQWKLTGSVEGKPLSESSCNHRRTALMHFFTVLNGKGGSNPVKDVPRFREPDPVARGVSFTQLQKVFDQMPETKTKARVLVLAFTGLPHATLMRLKPEDVNVETKTLTAPRRRKGKGTKTRVLPLSPQAIKAFKMLTRFDGWGNFSQPSLLKSLQRACVKAGVPLMRGYDLRHSFGTAAYLASGDIRAVQALLDHSDAKLTERYTLGAVDARMRSALAAMTKVSRKVTAKRKSSAK